MKPLSRPCNMRELNSVKKRKPFTAALLVTVTHSLTATHN